MAWLIEVVKETGPRGGLDIAKLKKYFNPLGRMCDYLDLLSAVGTTCNVLRDVVLDCSRFAERRGLDMRYPPDKRAIPQIWDAVDVVSKVHAAEVEKRATQVKRGVNPCQDM